MAPSVGGSGVDFDVRAGVDARPAVHYALSAIKGVGEAQAQALVEAGGNAPSLRSARWRRGSTRNRSTRRRSRAWRRRGVRLPREGRATAFAAIEPMLAIANTRGDGEGGGPNALFGEADAAPMRRTPRRGRNRSGSGASSTPSASSSPAIRSKSATRRSNGSGPRAGPICSRGARRRLDRAARGDRSRPL